ncbi:uncharacterized protein [Palaemon carinicauda]|uniref:uncharacterized protein n=1 Tax=Palaemon carinicauda TaxID=392227 RepID=UPI0035B5FF8F
MRTVALETGSVLPTISRTRKSMDQSGTWSKHTSPKKTDLRENSVLKEDPFLLMMDSMVTETDLVSDLNTPDIKFEDFNFKRGNSGNMDVESSPAIMQSTVGVICCQNDDTVTVKAHKTDAAYALFDMSPVSRDHLQAQSPISQDDLSADQHEQRINIEDYQESFSTANVISDEVTYNDQIFTATIAELDYYMQESSSPIKHCTLPDQQKMPALHNSPPQLSISDSDLDFSIPENLLEEMETLFPEEQAIETNAIQSGNVCTTELDMYLGQQGFHNDLLSESLQQSGIFDDELESFGCEDEWSVKTPLRHCEWSTDPQIHSLVPKTDAVHMSTTPINQAGPSNTVNLMQAAESHTILLTQDSLPVTLQPPSSALHESNFSTPSIMNTSSIGAVPRTPRKKRQPQEETTPILHAVKRQRRSSRKPLRFREHYTDGEITDSASNEGFTDSDNRLGIEAVDEEIKNLNLASTNGSATRTRGAVEGLTEVEKYHRIRILNNEASKRCRLKRKSTVKEMEAQLADLEKRNLQLRKKHEALKLYKDKFQAYVSNFFKNQLTKKQ